MKDSQNVCKILENRESTVTLLSELILLGVSQVDELSRNIKQGLQKEGSSGVVSCKQLWQNKWLRLHWQTP